MKALFLCLCCLVTLLAGCSTNTDPYAAFRHEGAKAIFQKGEVAMNKGNYDTAAKQFDAIEALYPFSPYSQHAQLDLIYAYYKNYQNDEAAVAADRYIRLYPRGAHIDYAYYIKGIVSYQRGLTWMQKLFSITSEGKDVSHLKDAYKAFSQIVRWYPKSVYYRDAARRMTYIRDVLAQHELSIAQFYFKRKAYVAAANRASYVLEHYQGAPQVVDALRMQVKAYRKMHMDKLADQSLSILKKNYP